MNRQKSLISILLLGVYSMMIVHSMTHIHTHNTDFDTIATSYECVEQQLETNSTCSCACSHATPITTKKATNIDIRVACQNTACIHTHNEDDHQHHECNIVTIYDNTTRDANDYSFGSEVPSFDIPYILFADEYNNQLAELTINTSYLLRQIPLPKSAYVIGANSLRAPPVVIFS